MKTNKDHHNIFVCKNNIHIINFGEGGKITKKILLTFLFLFTTAVLAPAGNRLVPDEYVPNEIIIKFHKTVVADLEEQLKMKTPTGKLKLSMELDELNKKYRIKDAQAVFKNFKKNRDKTKALLKKDKTLLTKKEKGVLARIKRAPKGARIPELERIYKLRIELEEGQSLQEVVAAFNSKPEVEYAELNYIVSTNLTPNDPLYPLQWSLNNTGQIYPESGKYNTPPGTPDCDIDAPEAWDIYTGSPDVIVAVVDSGVDYRHRDLDDNMWVNAGEIAGNGVDDDDNGYVDDIYGYDFYNYDGDPSDDRGHGTHCAGITAAKGNRDPNSDIAGICWSARIMALKFLGSGGTGSTSDAVTAIYYAVENGADVISNSWGKSSYTHALKEAVDYAHSQGVIMVASAGNKDSDRPQYPAYYDHMISVAATDSNDDKASFSNYGDWVDIAAPGVDILSLRAENTSKGTVYDDYTTIMSGTSMACPHVAGACALLLSVNPELTCDDVNDILKRTVDPIAPEICQSGRLNLVKALFSVVSSKGCIILDNDYYSCADVVGIFLADIDLRGNTTQQAMLATNGGDLETVSLTKTPPNIGIFRGTIPTNSDAPTLEDNTLQLSHGEIITATYEDANDGTGNPATVTDTALADCVPPVIFNVRAERISSIGATITFETDEPTTGRIRYDLACSEPYAIVSEDPNLATVHAVKILGLSRETSYYFIAGATDLAGNETTDDNNGWCYSFTTGKPEVVNVPGDFPTIQEAIDAVWEGDIVIVADGTYTGPGNCDIDFHGQVITVRSRKGPENCIIDCNGSEEQPHCGFYFHSDEDAGSILKGFTITNGYAPDGKGGAIRCFGSSPTIDNCIISGNSAQIYGGGMYNYYSNPKLTDCNFTANVSEWGGAMFNESSSLIISNCIFTENLAFVEDAENGCGGGAIYHYTGSPTLTNCTFTKNAVDASYHGGGAGGAIFFGKSSPTLINCIITGNYSRCYGGGMTNWYGGHSTLINCIFSNNSSREEGGAMDNYESRITVINCTYNNNTAMRGGALINYKDSSPQFINCSFTGNRADYYGGAMFNYRCNLTLANCLLAGNSTVYYGGTTYNENSVMTLTNCTFAANSAPKGNALFCDSDPKLDPSRLDLTNCILRDVGDEIWNNDDSVITITYSNVKGGWADPGGNNIDIDPNFVDAGYWDSNSTPADANDDFWIEGNYHLLTGSLCIDAGDPNYSPEPNETDLDGKPRIIGGRIDMGAYEYNPYTYEGTCWDPNECPCQPYGDATCDGSVNTGDLMTLKAAWGQNATWTHPFCCADFNQDDKVNLGDLIVLKSGWGTSCPGSSTGNQKCYP